MESEKDIVKDIQDGDSKNIMITDAGVQNKELTNPQETGNADLPYSNSEGVANEVQSPIGTIEKSVKEDSEQLASSAIEEEGSLEPSVITSGNISEIAGDISELHIDIPIQLASSKSDLPSLQTQAEGETKCKLNEMKLDQEVGPKEEELGGKETPTELLPELKLDQEVGTVEEKLGGNETATELVPELKLDHEVGTMEEELGGNKRATELVPEMKLDQEVGTMEEELGGNETATELVPEMKLDQEVKTMEEELGGTETATELVPEMKLDQEVGTVEEELGGNETTVELLPEMKLDQEVGTVEDELDDNKTTIELVPAVILDQEKGTMEDKLDGNKTTIELVPAVILDQETGTMEDKLDGNKTTIELVPAVILDQETGTMEDKLDGNKTTIELVSEIKLDQEMGTIEEELDSNETKIELVPEIKLDQEIGTMEDELDGNKKTIELVPEKNLDQEMGTMEDELVGNETKSELVPEKNLDQEMETLEDELGGNATTIEVVPASQRKGETLNNSVNMTAEGEQREEELISGSNGLEFHQDDKTREDVVTEPEIPLENGIKGESSRSVIMKEDLDYNDLKEELTSDELDEGDAMENNNLNNSFLLGPDATEDEETGTPEEQAAFIKELEIFHRERFLDFRPPRFYQEPLNLLKLWRSVVRLGGYDQVTSCKHWRQIGESFKPPKTCTTVSWTFRCFYEKALLEYEKHKLRCGELPFTGVSFPDHFSAGSLQGVGLALGPGRQRRDAASRAMQGWHSQRLLGNGEVGASILKDKNSSSILIHEKPLRSNGLLKRKMPSPVDHDVEVEPMKASYSQSEAEVFDDGYPADWVKINVQRTKDCFEVYALVPGLLREEVKVQCYARGRLVISGQPEKLDNPWGVTPFRKVVELPSRIDPHQTSAVVTLQGQLFVRVPYDPLDL